MSYGVVDNGLDTRPQPVSCLGPFLPMWRKAILHVPHDDVGDSDVVQRPGIFAKRHLPLCTVLRVRPLTRLGLEQLLHAMREGDYASRLFRSSRINASRKAVPDSFSLFPRQREGYGRGSLSISSEPDLCAIGASPKDEDPLLRASLAYANIEAVAVAVDARTVQPLDVAFGELVSRHFHHRLP